MLVDFALVIGVTSILGTWQNKHLHDVLFPTIITEEILERNVALTNFMGKIAIVVTRR
jgi:hypothetical protein